MSCSIDLGDSHLSPGMLEFMSLVRKIHPGLFIHSIYVEEDLKKDQRAGWVRSVNIISALSLADFVEVRKC
jgi:palmitoyl-protein thioesterase